MKTIGKEFCFLELLCIYVQAKEKTPLFQTYQKNSSLNPDRAQNILPKHTYIQPPIWPSTRRHDPKLEDRVCARPHRGGLPLDNPTQSHPLSPQVKIIIQYDLNYLLTPPISSL
ncbi:hypothetical protein Sjap_009331 [Stephania japonica]|uniref:Uncharacterized protein n=1 Tax=Stephania japonica TaxID=461633 RepID=A0AAP0JTL7_9MAGN